MSGFTRDHVRNEASAGRHGSDPTLHEAALHEHRLQMLGSMVGGIAHDFANLLTVIVCQSQRLGATQPLDEAGRSALEEIESAASQAAEATQALLAFSRPAKPQPRPCDLNTIARDGYRLCRRIMRAVVQFDLDLAAKPLPVVVDAGQIQQLLVNLCVLGQEALPGRGRLVIQTREVESGGLPPASRPKIPADAWVRLSVLVSGPAVTPAPFGALTGPQGGQATGGAAASAGVVGAILANHDGFLHVADAASGQARVDAFFPAAEAMQNEALGSDMPAARGDERVLIVEDEDMLANLLRTVLEDQGYEVTLAARAQEAIERVRRKEMQPDLAIVDYGLPDMTGDACLARLRASQPDLPAILITGYDRDEAAVLALGCEVIRKPFSVPTIVERVRQALDHGACPNSVGKA